MNGSPIVSVSRWRWPRGSASVRMRTTRRCTTNAAIQPIAIAPRQKNSRCRSSSRCSTSVASSPCSRRRGIRELDRLGTAGHAVQADVAVLDDVHRVVEETLDRFGRIDTFCSNAMVTIYREARELSWEELHRVFDVNFFGGVNAYQASLPA